MSSLETGRASVFAGVFVQTNERGTNRVPAFRRGADGALEPAREYPTGGSGPVPITRPRKRSLTLAGSRKGLLDSVAGLTAK